MRPGRYPPYRQRMGFRGTSGMTVWVATQGRLLVGWWARRHPTPQWVGVGRRFDPPPGASGQALVVVHRANAVAEEVQAAPHRPQGAGDVAGINRWPPCRAFSGMEKVCAVV